MQTVDLIAGILLVALFGNLCGSAWSAVAGRRMRRFHEAQRIADKMERRGPGYNPRSKQ